MVYTEAIVTDYESAQGYPRQSRITTQKQIDAWKTVVQAIRESGSMSVLQMFHCGRMAWEGINPARPEHCPERHRPAAEQSPDRCCLSGSGGHEPRSISIMSSTALSRRPVVRLPPALMQLRFMEPTVT